MMVCTKKFLVKCKLVEKNLQFLASYYVLNITHYTHNDMSHEMEMTPRRPTRQY